MIVKLIPVTPFQQNCAVCVCPVTKEAVVIDPGGDVEKIEAAIQAAGAKLVKILVTHAHLDHASAVADLARRHDVPIEGPHKEDQFWIDLLPSQAAQYGFAPAETFVPDRWLDDGDVCTFGEVSFHVLHTPGHTPGHVVFFNPKDQVVFVGDVLFQGSIGRTDFPRGDFDTLISAIQTKLLPLGDNVTFHCGHGPSSTLGHEARTNPFLLEPDRFRGMM